MNFGNELIEEQLSVQLMQKRNNFDFKSFSNIRTQYTKINLIQLLKIKS